MGGATLSLPRLPLGSLRSPIFFVHAVFPLLFPPMRSLVPRLLRAYTRVLYRTVSFTVFFVSHERSERSNTRS